MLEHGYYGVTAQMQAGKANDLLGVACATRHQASRTRYVLINPGGVSTSFAGEYDAPTAAHVAPLKRYGNRSRRASSRSSPHGRPARRIAQRLLA